MLGIFHPARAGHAILKLTASLSAGRSSRPRPPGSSFSSGRKGCKRPFKRDFVPLKDSPVGEPSGRVPHTPTAGFLSGNSRCSESALAFFAGRTPPISALYQVRTSRPSLRGLARANCARSSAALWNYVPTLGLWGSSGSEMPAHFRKCARLRRAQRGYALQGRALR